MVVLRALAFFALLLSCSANRIVLAGHSHSRVKQQFETKHNARGERKALSTRRGSWIGGLRHVPTPGRFQPQLPSQLLNVPVTMQQQQQGPPDLTRRALLTGVAGASIAWPSSASAASSVPPQASWILQRSKETKACRSTLKARLDSMQKYVEKNAGTLRPDVRQKTSEAEKIIRQTRSLLAEPQSVKTLDKMIAEVDAFIERLALE